MRSGKLDRTITIQRYDDSAIDDYGTPFPNWTDHATIRAQVLQQSTEEFIENRGADDEAVMVFKTRYVDATTCDRIAFDDSMWNIKEIAVKGRNRALEIRCMEAVS